MCDGLIVIEVFGCMFFYVVSFCLCVIFGVIFFFQAEDGIRDLVRSRGLGDVYKRQCRKSDLGTTACRRSGLIGTCISGSGGEVSHSSRMLSLIHI